MKQSVVFVLALLLAVAFADLYIQNPRGMNDRCDEESNDRNNDQRMYNSNDNAAGGYAWCDQEMVFFEDTLLHIEWTNQHSCGNGANNKDDPTNPQSTVCQLLLQLGCEPNFKLFAWPLYNEFSTYTLQHGASLGRLCADRPDAEGCTGPNDNPLTTTAAFTTFGDTCTQTRPLTETCTSANNDPSCATLNLSTDAGTFNGPSCQCSPRKYTTYGVHEPENWYLQCRARQRNQGTFVADQNPNPAGGSTNTRQEPNSARYGYECTEERDYYPYFHPVPWIDLAIFTSSPDANCSYYQSQSQNVADKCACLPAPGSYDVNTPSTVYDAWFYNQEYQCKHPAVNTIQTNWMCYGNWGMAPPACVLAQPSTDNRLGNMDMRGSIQDTLSNDGTLSHFDWNIPSGFVSSVYAGANNNLQKLISAGYTNLTTITPTDVVRCTLRMRYNISTNDIAWNFDQFENSAISTNPVKVYGYPYIPPTTAPTTSSGSIPTDAVPDSSTAQTVPIRHAINTAQYGRTFQDRSYVFQVKTRSQLPSNVPQSATIWNLNTRGKRGNIAQVRNCVEYDYVPKMLNVNVGDWVLFQWCGSDYNPQGNAGEGLAGTDRNNIVVLRGDGYGINYLSPHVTDTVNGTDFPALFSTTDLLALAWIGQDPKQCYGTYESISASLHKNSDQDPMSCHFLNGPRQPGKPYMPTAYFFYFAQVIQSGTLNFMSSRNNNFSNRSQKGTIIASNGISAGVIAGAVIGSIVGVAAIAGLSYLGYKNKDKILGGSRV